MSAALETPVSATTRTIPLGMLRESPTNPRKTFNEKALNELASSITEHGLLQPILVRSFNDDGLAGYEIVAGHRRSRACAIAGLTEIECVVRSMEDHEVRRIQLVENGQRADLTPLEEADAYADLIAETGMSVREVAATVSRDPSTIAARLRLHSLCDAAKKALNSGTLPVSHAELIARIPEESLQEQALDDLLPMEWLDDGSDKRVRVAVPLQTAKRLINERYTTALATAPFDPEDDTLSPLGKCSTCPHRTGNNRDLFGGVVKGKNVCTNPADFQLKVGTMLLRKKDEGYRVLMTKEELKAAFPASHNPDWVGDAYVDLEGICYDDPKRRTYGQLLGDDQKQQIVLAYQNGRVRTLYPKALVRDAVEASGHQLAMPEGRPRGGTDAEKAMRAQQRLERAIRYAIINAYVETIPKAKVTMADWINLLTEIAIADQSWRLDDVLPRHGFEGTKEQLQKGDREKIARELVAGMTDGQKRAFVIDVYINSWYGPNAYGSKREVFKGAMELLGVDVKAIDKRIRKEFAAKAKEKAKKDA